MKRNINKLIALILALASLVSMLTVFAYAEDGEAGDDVVTESVRDALLLYNRGYEEGWDVDNGLDITGSHKVEIDYEERSDKTYNYFTRITAQDNLSEGKIKVDFGVNIAREKATIISFDIKADDACDLNEILRFGNTKDARKTNLLYVRNKTLYAFAPDQDHKIASLENNDWVNVTFYLDWSDRLNFNGSVFVNKDYSNPAATHTFNYGTNNDGSPKEDSGASNVTFLVPASSSAESSKAKEGMSYCLDNLQVYQGVTTIFSQAELDSVGYGTLVEKNAKKTINIKKSANDKTNEQLLKEALCLKLGVPYALMRDEKISIKDYSTPAKDANGNILVSLELLLDYIGYDFYAHPDGLSYDITTGLSSTYITVGRDTANVDGNYVELTTAPGYDTESGALVIAAQDIPVIFPGWNMFYDDMGLIIMYEAMGEGDTGLLTRQNDLDLMLDMMKRFVFETTPVSGKDYDSAYTQTGMNIVMGLVNKVGNVVDDAIVGFKHPYIYADQATFDKLNAAFDAKEGDENYNAKLNEYIANAVAKADSYYNEVAELDANDEYLGIKEGMEPANVYFDGQFPDASDPTDTTVADSDDGYNPKTLALYEIEEISAKLVDLAFAYQVTGDDKYARLAYDATVAFGEWVHWAPGFFVNCATATNNIAVSYDWLYNAYVKLVGKEATLAIAEMIYTKGLHEGYLASSGESVSFARTSGTGYAYTTRTDSFNAISAAGMIIGSLAAMDYAIVSETAAEEMFYLIGNNFHNLVAYGLDQYAPDGSYIESTTYWARGTNALMQLIMTLDSATGNTYGLTSTWGIDKTFYFACYMEDSDGKNWGYHEDGVGTIISGDALGVDTQMFNYAGMLLKDENLIAIRQAQLEKGKEATIFDILFYPTKTEFDKVELELDYHMQGIDAFVSRSDWENGALYVGIMGGLNDYSPYGTDENDGESFGQIDAGNFIYRNQGISWFDDLGSESYGVLQYFGSQRYNYYRNSGEGHNVVLITSAQGAIPYGQAANGEGVITSTYISADGEGSFVIMDTTSAYGSYVEYAKRGMLTFNNRETVVIQDDVSFTEFQTATWVAQTGYDIVIDETGKTAYIEVRNGYIVEYTLRATLLTASSALKFSVMDANPFLTATSSGDANEFARDGLQRLCIKTSQTLGFDVAVAFEIVDSKEDDKSCAYTKMSMDFWTTIFENVDEEDTAERRGKAVRSDIINRTNDAEFCFDESTAFSKEFARYYRALTDVRYTLTVFPADSFEITDVALQDAYELYLDLCDEYDDFREYMNDYLEATHKAANVFAGNK